MNFRLLCFVAGSEGVKLVVLLDFEDPIKLRSIQTDKTCLLFVDFFSLFFFYLLLL